MRYKLKPIQCRPWTLSYLSVELIEGHYENNYRGALRRLNAITEQLESLDFLKRPRHRLEGRQGEELVERHATLPREACLANLGRPGQPNQRRDRLPAR